MTAIIKSRIDTLDPYLSQQLSSIVLYDGSKTVIRICVTDSDFLLLNTSTVLEYGSQANSQQKLCANSLISFEPVK